ncbi:MAG: nucleotidyl transferase AbiEii/AbiGii toxin family protein [Candidatus Firestonebacteria bacterium]|nr:nucleotidyl transferase AbiEii/AbiGii toxin family protein [Candidatus Firestonebacteria bacterium]
MMKNSRYYEQAKLMLRVLPHVAMEKCFVLKGGTALNLFLRDMPRLSVDIDLTYLPIESRTETIKNIHQSLKKISASIQRAMPDCKCLLSESKDIAKIFVRNKIVQIKIEPNYVIRGTVFPCSERQLCAKAETLFEMSTSITTVSIPDLYGGKICAALDRQHPRDFYDIKILFENEGLTDDIRKAFVVYLASGDRPMNEVVEPTKQNFLTLYKNEFEGMTTLPIKYQELVQAREMLISQIKNSLSNNEKMFLLSIKAGFPKWELLGVAGIDRLPAIQWKLSNINKMSAKKRSQAIELLKRKLDL